MIERERAFEILKENIKSQNLIYHSLAVEAGMRELAKYFGEDEEKWGIAGLLHDVDYEKTKGDQNLHSRVGAQILEELGFEKEICEAVLTHNDVHQILPKTKMAKALYCLDPLTGLIVAATLVLPSKKINDLKVENVLKRFKEKAFAKGANREIIKKCEEFLDIPLEKFIEIALLSMQKISDKIGL
jgi:putative nucleotidyltransferase with HDIG domain